MGYFYVGTILGTKGTDLLLITELYLLYPFLYLLELLRGAENHGAPTSKGFFRYNHGPERYIFDPKRYISESERYIFDPKRYRFVINNKSASCQDYLKVPYFTVYFLSNRVETVIK